jgi:hypothetical protein
MLTPTAMLELLHASYIDTAIAVLALATLAVRHLLHSAKIVVGATRAAVVAVGHEWVDLVEEWQKLRADVAALRRRARSRPPENPS